jgi:ATP-dependent helicase/nuclease subunit B
MTASEALGRIGSIASEIIFQAEAKQAVVQILGPLEAAGLQFDKLWVSGVSASNWPPRGAPISLLSRDLQREHKMPDATPNDTLAYAKRVIRRLMSTGSEVVVSYPVTQGDAQQAPSELLHEYEVHDGGELSDPGWNALDVSKGSSGVEITGDRVPAFQRDEILAGGAGTIQRQFVEPFAAFATGRLGIRLLWPIMSGLSAGIRGNLIHTALHRLYENCPSRDQISAWDDAEVDARTTKAVQAAFWPQEKNADPVLRCLLQIERARVQRLLRNVIRVDTARESFRIDSVEQATSLNIGDLALRLRIDRVDVESDGQLLILDYKTGIVKKLLDRDKNPKDMQLVVYACAMDRPIGGIALLNVDSRGVVLDGAGQQLTPKLDWDEALGNWKGQVEAAARNIVAGDVRINAQQSAQAARPLSLLSRHRELSRE